MKRFIPAILALFPTTVLAGTSQALGETGSDFTYTKLVKIVTELVKILLEIGGLCAVIAVVYYGLRMVMSRGDSSKFNDAKKGLGYAAVGALIIFGVYTIIATVQAGVKSVGN